MLYYIISCCSIFADRTGTPDPQPQTFSKLVYLIYFSFQPQLVAFCDH